LKRQKNFEEKVGGLGTGDGDDFSACQVEAGLGGVEDFLALEGKH